MTISPGTLCNIENQNKLIQEQVSAFGGGTRTSNIVFDNESNTFMTEQEKAQRDIIKNQGTAGKVAGFVYNTVASFPHNVVQSVTGQETTTEEKEITGLPKMKIVLPKIRKLPVKERVLKGVYGTTGTAMLLNPELYPSMLLGAGLSTAAGTGIRYVEYKLGGLPKSKIFSPSEIQSDIQSGMIVGGLSPLFPPALSPLRSGLVGAVEGPVFVGAKDISEDIASNKPVNIDRPLWHYALASGIGFAAGYGGARISNLIKEGKIGVIKPGYVKGAGEKYLGIYYQKGPRAKQLIGVVKRGNQIYVGRNLRFKNFTPEMEIKSPIEKDLELNAMLNWVKKQGEEKGWTSGQIKSLINIVEKIYSKPRGEVPVTSVKQIVNEMPRLKGLDKEKFYNIIIKPLQKGDAVLYGSSIQKMYGAINRETHDLDIQLQRGSAETIAQQLKKAFGNNIKIEPKEGGAGVEVYNKAGEKILEIFNPHHGYSLLSEDYVGYGFGHLPYIKEGGVWSMQLREQTARKLASSLKVQEGGVYPTQKRVKDLPDLLALLKYYSSKYPDVRTAFEKFLKQPSNYNLQSLLDQATQRGIKFDFVLMGVNKGTYYPSQLSRLFAIELSSPSISSYISKFAKNYFATTAKSKSNGNKKDGESDKSTSTSSSGTSSGGVLYFPSGSNYSSPGSPSTPAPPPSLPSSGTSSYSTSSLSSPSISYPISSGSSSTSGSSTSPSTVSVKSTVPLYYPVPRGIDFNPPSPNSVMYKTRIVNELKYI